MTMFRETSSQSCLVVSLQTSSKTGVSTILSTVPHLKSRHLIKKEVLLLFLTVPTEERDKTTFKCHNIEKKVWIPFNFHGVAFLLCPPMCDISADSCRHIHAHLVIHMCDDLSGNVVTRCPWVSGAEHIDFSAFLNMKNNITNSLLR